LKLLEFDNPNNIFGDEKGKEIKKDKASWLRRIRKILEFISMGKYPSKMYYKGRTD
jgi:hypothetical protein